MRRSLVLGSVGAVVLFSGCLGRTGIGLDDLASSGAYGDDPYGGDAGSEVSIVEAGPDATVRDSGPAPKPDTAGVDRFIDIWDVIPIPDSGPIGACASCVRDKCGSSVNQCINSAKCRDGLACVATRCLAGAAGGGGGGGGPGGIDFKCLNDCFGGDFAAAGLAITTFTCVLNNCGPTCGSIFGGGEGGLPGLPGLPGGGTPGGGTPASPGLSFADFERDPTFHVGFSREAYVPWRAQLDQAACEQGLASCPPR